LEIFNEIQKINNVIKIEQLNKVMHVLFNNKKTFVI